MMQKEFYVYNRLKGDGDIKNYKIRFLGTGYKDLYQVNLKIYDTHNNIISKLKTYNGEVNVLLEKNKVYIFKTIFLNKKICIPIYLNDKENALINLNYSINRSVTFLLTDYYYNLPIKKGEIILG